MVMRRGMLEILQLADGSEPKKFSDFTKMSVKKRKLSSATVSKRLDELIIVAAVEEVITRSSNGRRVIAYRTTEKGRIIIRHAKELEEALAKLKNK
jgi:predicted transcriptional regulator